MLARRATLKHCHPSPQENSSPPQTSFLSQRPGPKWLKKKQRGCGKCLISGLEELYSHANGDESSFHNTYNFTPDLHKLHRSVKSSAPVAWGPGGPGPGERCRRGWFIKTVFWCLSRPEDNSVMAREAELKTQPKSVQSMLQSSGACVCGRACAAVRV